MISGLKIHKLLTAGVGPEKVSFTLDPYQPVRGPVRAMQKFTVILLSTRGTDALRPWFGTQIPIIGTFVVHETPKFKLFIQDEVNSAINQFFRLQDEEAERFNQTKLDKIDAIELLNVSVDEYNRFTLDILFTPADGKSLVYSVEVRDTENLRHSFQNFSSKEYRQYLEDKQKRELTEIKV